MTCQSVTINNTKYPHLSEVTRVELVHQDSVVVLTTSITATSGMLSVFSDTTMTRANVSSLLPVFAQTRWLSPRGSEHSLSRIKRSLAHHFGLCFGHTLSCVCAPVVDGYYLKGGALHLLAPPL